MCMFFQLLLCMKLKDFREPPLWVIMNCHKFIIRLTAYLFEIVPVVDSLFFKCTITSVFLSGAFLCVIMLAEK
jgi:hypothetical protein